MLLDFLLTILGRGLLKEQMDYTRITILVGRFAGHIRLEVVAWLYKVDVLKTETLHTSATGAYRTTTAVTCARMAVVAVMLMLIIITVVMVAAAEVVKAMAVAKVTSAREFNGDYLIQQRIVQRNEFVPK